MSLKILVDMNLSPDWISRFQVDGIPAVHWSTIGDPRAPDRVIMDWAQANHHVVFTHDLDFGTALALTHKSGPSVIQLRGDDVLPDRMGDLAKAAIRRHQPDLEKGALAVVEERKNRVRILPI